MPFPAILSPSQSQVGNRSFSSAFRCSQLMAAWHPISDVGNP